MAITARVSIQHLSYMPTPLTTTELEHLLNFVGYGELDADVWFLGMEEAGGGEENLRARLKFRAVEDCAEAHQILGIRKHHWGKKIIQRTWRGMCYIMLCLAGQETTTENIRNYQADQLGRFGHNSLLCELTPIPKPSIGSWGYEELIPQYASAADYYSTVLPRRHKYLRELLSKHSPKVVIGYGKKYWPDYQRLFPDLEFSARGQFSVGKSNTCTVVLTDHLTARSMNGKLDQVVKIIQE